MCIKCIENLCTKCKTIISKNGEKVKINTEINCDLID